MADRPAVQTPLEEVLRNALERIEERLNPGKTGNPAFKTSECLRIAQAALAASTGSGEEELPRDMTLETVKERYGAAGSGSQEDGYDAREAVRPLLDAITPPDGSMPDPGRVQVEAENLWGALGGCRFVAGSGHQLSPEEAAIARDFMEFVTHDRELLLAEQSTLDKLRAASQAERDDQAVFCSRCGVQCVHCGGADGE